MFYSRKHIRLRDFDYSLSNAYFITICIKDFNCLLGEIRKGVMGLSEIGNVAAIFLQQIPEIREGVSLDEFILMPNHLHFVIQLNRNDDLSYQFNAYAKPVAGSVSVIVNQYKGAVKKWCNANGFKDFEWQSRFYDHVIRDQQSYDNVCQYIRNNPINWEKDKTGSDLLRACPASTDKMIGSIGKIK